MDCEREPEYSGSTLLLLPEEKRLLFMQFMSAYRNLVFSDEFSEDQKIENQKRHDEITQKCIDEGLLKYICQFRDNICGMLKT